jgi:hypothetical protein
MNNKPLRRPLESAPRFPQSRRDSLTRQGTLKQIQRATEKPRRDDYIWVTEKLDGCNTSVLKKDGDILALQKNGFLADASQSSQINYWSVWVAENRDRFDALLKEGELVVGEWCIQAHGTTYCFSDEPFFVLDIFSNNKRILYYELRQRLSSLRKPFETPEILFHGKNPVSVDDFLDYLEVNYRGHHGALEAIEGAVWRIENKNRFDFLIAYVSPEKSPGCYLPHLRGRDETYIVWNWWGASGSYLDTIKNQDLAP